MRRALPPGGGGTAVLPTVRAGYLTPGNVSPFANTAGTWQDVPGFTWTVPAVAGNAVTTSVKFLAQFTSTSTFLDIAVKVGGVNVRYASSGTAVQAVEGDPGLYNQLRPYGGGGFEFTATSGDISGGVVTFQLIVKSPGDSTLFASAAYPFFYLARSEGSA